MREDRTGPKPRYKALNSCPECGTGNRLVRTVWKVGMPLIDDRPPGPPGGPDLVGIVSCSKADCRETTRRSYDAIVAA